MPPSPKTSTSHSSKWLVAERTYTVAHPAKPVAVFVPEEPFILRIDIPDDDDGMTEFPQFMFSIYPNFNYADEIVDLIHVSERNFKIMNFFYGIEVLFLWMVV